MEAVAIKSDEEEIIRLKKKCNALIQKINAQDQEKKELEQQLHQAYERIELLLRENATFQKNNQKIIEENDITNFINSFSQIIRKAYADNSFIPYKNYSKNSSKYLKIEKDIFDEYIKQLDGTDIQFFFECCVDLNFLKADENRKYIFSDTKDKKNIRIYFVNKALAEKFNG